MEVFLMNTISITAMVVFPFFFQHLLHYSVEAGLSRSRNWSRTQQHDKPERDELSRCNPGLQCCRC